MVGFLFYRENHPPLVLGFCFSPYRIETPSLVRIPTGIPKSSPNLLPSGGSCRERPPKVSFLEVPAPFSQFLKNHKDVKNIVFFVFLKCFVFCFFSLFFSTVFFPTFFGSQPYFLNIFDCAIAVVTGTIAIVTAKLRSGLAGVVMEAVSARITVAR